MKRILVLMALILLPLAMSAQMSSFFERYNGQQGYQSIVYGKRMLDMMKDNASPDVKSLLDRISSIRIISCDRQDDHIVGIARRNVVGENYEVISQIQEDGSSSYFYIKEIGRKSKDVSFVMIVGEFDVKDISKLLNLSDMKKRESSLPSLSC